MLSSVVVCCPVHCEILWNRCALVSKTLRQGMWTWKWKMWSPSKKSLTLLIKTKQGPWSWKRLRCRKFKRDFSHVNAFDSLCMFMSSHVQWCFKQPSFSLSATLDSFHGRGRLRYRASGVPKRCHGDTLIANQEDYSGRVLWSYLRIHEIWVR